MSPTSPNHFQIPALLLLALATAARAHGGGEMDSMEDMPSSIQSNYTLTEPESYSQLGDHISMLAIHVVLMTVAWVGVLPIGVLLSIAKYKKSILVQVVFLATNALGLVFGIIYNAATPDLYPNNAHHKLGWVLTWIAVAQGFMALINTYGGRWEAQSHKEERVAFIPVSTEAMAEHQRISDLRSGLSYDNRFSGDSGQGTERNTESLVSHSPSPSVEHGRFNLGDLRQEFEESERLEKQSVNRSHRLEKYLSRKLSGLSGFRILSVFDVLYKIVDRVILLLGFTAYMTGLITFGGIFKGSSVFNGLAHWIKGGIFFWYGILTLARWTGCFADLGWAWNIRPSRSMVGPRKANAPSAEFLECFLFFLYGSTNIFLEHLAAWGDKWAMEDLEHISITVLFMGGGVLGMLVESTTVRNLLNTSAMELNQATTPFPYKRVEPSQEKTDPWIPPQTYKFSMNPVPAIVMLLLGFIMSAHTQETAISTMVHKQWGTLFLCASMARAVTYILFYLKPPTSYLPSRPPSEVITAFCLMVGGAIFMGSARDVIHIMITHSVGPMFIFVVCTGVIMMAMAWVVGVIAIRGLVLQKAKRPFESFQVQERNGA